VHRVGPELAPGDGSGLGWLGIVVAGRVFAMMGIGGSSNLSIKSSIIAGSGEVGSLAGGQDLCMVGVLLAHRFHMQMGGLS
jgi:hypothetical protein